ncbi:type II secretion system F family protein [bacterium]|nr:type II secretion system F family protein [bacterium]
MSALRESARLARDLHVLLSTGLAVDQALGRICSQASGRWAAGLRKAQEAAASGSSLAEALRSAGSFPKLLVEGMEAAADHEPLARISELLEESDWRQGQIRLVLSYPVILLAAGLALVWLVYGMLGATFTELLGGMSLKLPFFTQMTLLLVRMASNPWVITLEIALIAFVYWLLSGAAGTAALRLRLPLVGDWIRRSESVTWLSWVDYFLATGLSVPESMRRAAAACGDVAFRAKMEAAAAAADRGQELSKALGREKALPELGLLLVARGEGLEFPPHYLARVAAVLKREQDTESEGGLAILEVAGVLAMLLVIPPVIIGFFLPLYQLIGNIA